MRQMLKTYGRSGLGNRSRKFKHAHGRENAFRQVVQPRKEEERRQQNNSGTYERRHLRACTDISIHSRTASTSAPCTPYLDPIMPTHRVMEP